MRVARHLLHPLSIHLHFGLPGMPGSQPSGGGLPFEGEGLAAGWRQGPRLQQGRRGLQLQQSRRGRRFACIYSLSRASLGLTCDLILGLIYFEGSKLRLTVSHSAITAAISMVLVGHKKEEGLGTGHDER